MRDEPLEIDGSYDFEEFREYVHETFLVYLFTQEVMRCETLGEFAHFVYSELQADRTMLNDREAMYERMIDQMNSASVDHRRSEFSLHDLDAIYEAVLKDRAKKNWIDLGHSAQLVLGSGLARIQMKWYSKAIAWALFASLLAGTVYVGIDYGFILGALAFVCGFIPFGIIANHLPCRVSKGGIRLRELMDQRIERLANRQLAMSLPEVQLWIFDTYASWAGGQDPDTVNSDTPFPY